jgi:hypothetical protein
VDDKKQDYDMTHEELNPKLDIGHGNPGSPLFGQVLSEEDEKRVDDMGEEVVKGKVWSESGTGVYLSVALHTREKAGPLKPLVAQVDIDLTKAGPKDWTLTLGAGYGKPTFSHPVVGACLELPEDLALDLLKKQYVVEWLVNTIDEALKNRELGIRTDARKHFAAAVAEAASASIGRVF